MNFFLTGGAGFIGSHIADRLLQNKHKVTVFDNFSTGKKLFIKHNLRKSNFRLIQGDLLDLKKLKKAIKGADFVFSLAGHADVKEGINNHEIDHLQNLETTRNLLEAMYQNNIKKIAFSSTSVVYGDAVKKPTPEFYPLSPNSFYSASKAACEMYIQTYGSYYDWRVFIFRFIPFLGERYNHGIIYDLTKKILKNPKFLEIFSDGTPKKSFIYIKDGIDLIFKVTSKSKQKINIYNVGTDRIVTIDQIVNIIMNTLKVNLPKKYLGGERGWKGDDKYIHLDTTKAKSLGWRPKVKLEEAIFKTIDYLQKNPELLK